MSIRFSATTATTEMAHMTRSAMRHPEGADDLENDPFATLRKEGARRPRRGATRRIP